MKVFIPFVIGVFIAALCLVNLAHSQIPLGTDFTFQGQLQDNGQPADGTYDLEFRLWTSETAGIEVAPAVILNGTNVANGFFSVTLDFGADAFDGDQRWISMKVNGMTLAPRQPVTATPYALQTRGMFVNDDKSFVGIGRETPITAAEYFGINAPVSSGYGGMYVSTNGDNARPFYGYSAGGDVDAYHYLDGATDKWHLVNNGPRITVTNEGDVGIGTTSPSNRLHVEATADTAVHGSSTFIGVVGWTTGSVGRGVDGVAFGANAQNIAVRGYCTSTIGYDFYAAGPGQDYGSSSSIRWKSNVKPIENSLSKLAQLRGVYFDWNEEHGGHHDVGMIAEEVGKVLPEIVTYEENGVDARGMDYSKLTPLLVQAVNELNDRYQRTLATHQLEMSEVKQENDSLRDRLSNLESMVAELTARTSEKQK